MPLASFAFTGCDAGHTPPSGSTHVDVVPGDESAARGWGGNGNGCGSQPTSVVRFASIARHTAYAVPARTPSPNARHTVPRRITADCRTRRVNGLVIRGDHGHHGQRCPSTPTESSITKACSSRSGEHCRARGRLLVPAGRGGI